MVGDFDFYVGIDLAAEKHQARVVNRTGKVVGEFAFEHSGAGLTEFIRSLDKLTGAAVDRVAIAAETPRGLVIECVLERGYSVFRLIQSSLTGSVTVTLWLVQKTIDETPLYWPTRCGQICRCSGGYSGRVRISFACVNSPGLNMI
ncbi:MAG TPA: transposase [Bryobacteraceae bacterium]|nr:transposase [Bryobacteraceae bacterium]